MIYTESETVKFEILNEGVVKFVTLSVVSKPVSEVPIRSITTGGNSFKSTSA